MNGFWYLLSVAALLFLIVLLTAYVCFRMAFYAPRNKTEDPSDYHLPPGKIYEPFYPTIIHWINTMRKLPCEHFYITSFDGLKLHARFYEYAQGAPIELMFHGYRSTGERDLCGGIARCRELGRSSLIVDQRGSAESEGNVITFGVNEHRDCLSWIDFTVKHFGPDVKILLCGISMGAATVTMAASHPLPTNVIGILADCGYTSAKAMIKKTIAEKNLPPKLLYPFVKLGARLYGKFDLEELSPVEAVRNCTVPAFFVHGDADDYVPWEMSRENYMACPARKHLLIVPGAGHGLSYPASSEQYVRELREFFGPEASHHEPDTKIRL